MSVCSVVRARDRGALSDGQTQPSVCLKQRPCLSHLFSHPEEDVDRRGHAITLVRCKLGYVVPPMLLQIKTTSKRNLYKTMRGITFFYISWFVTIDLCLSSTIEPSFDFWRTVYRLISRSLIERFFLACLCSRSSADACVFVLVFNFGLYNVPLAFRVYLIISLLQCSGNN